MAPELSTSSDDDSFSPQEQAAFDAMRSGSPAPEPEAAPAPPPEPSREPAPAPEAAAAPEQPQEPDEGDGDEGDGETEGNKGQYVRREALRQERERRKGLQKELAEAREAKARLDERLRIFAEANKAAQAQAAPQAAQPTDDDPEPNPEEDIFAHNRWIARQISKSNETAKQERERQQAQARHNDIMDRYHADAAQFTAKEPTFKDAYRHLYQSRAAELFAAGMTDHQQILRAIAADEVEIAGQAIQMGVSPAERIYQIARARGFVPKAPEPVADPAETAKPVAETAAQKAERVSAGQRGPGRSLSSVGGAPAGGLPTVEQLASMSEEDFAKFAKNNPGAVTALMGG